MFASILDAGKGGYFQISPSCEVTSTRQMYWPDTNILVTRFLSPDGVAEIRDFVPLGADREQYRHEIIRQVRTVRGTMPLHLECYPAFNYARDGHEVEVSSDGASFHSPNLSLGLAWAWPPTCPLDHQNDGVTADFRLNVGETATFVLREVEAEAACGGVFPAAETEELFEKTVDYWRGWLSQCTYEGRWREMVYRSALALKLMTFEPTGAIVASSTCSLPEGVGGERNWDYRYTWIRDAAFTLYGFLRIGFTKEAENFMGWLEERTDEPNPDGSLQILHGIDGRHELEEKELDHLEGYKGSSPVRIGNGAYDQLQLNIYGELMDAVYLYNKYGDPISYALWVRLRKLINWVCDNWQREDEGIWEIRSGRQHFVYSKLMCWVSLDRGLRLTDKRSFPADRARWLSVRDEIYEEIMEKGWSEDRQAFIQYYGSDTLDASNLIMPLVFFVAPKDPRMLSTLEAINRPVKEDGLVSDSLVYRYDVDRTEDGLDGEEGTFSMCTFWLVEALTRARRVDEARLIFEQMLTYANHLGLYAEQIGHSGEALGNFPQAFTHLAVISAAFNLDRVLGGGR